MTETSNTTTAKSRFTEALGLLGYKAVVDHAFKHGLTHPESIDYDRRHMTVFVLADPGRWVESIHVDDEHTHESVVSGHERVHVMGRLPDLGVRIRITYSRPIVTVSTPSHLRAVTA